MHFLLSSNEKRKRCFADVFNENPYSLLHFCINLGDIKNVCNKFNHFCQFCLKFHRERRRFTWPLVLHDLLVVFSLGLPCGDSLGLARGRMVGVPRLRRLRRQRGGPPVGGNLRPNRLCLHWASQGEVST